MWTFDTNGVRKEYININIGGVGVSRCLLVLR